MACGAMAGAVVGGWASANAIAAQTKVHETYRSVEPVSWTDTHPCTGDPLEFSGEIITHSSGTIDEVPGGIPGDQYVTHQTVRTDVRVSAVNLATGTQYRRIWHDGYTYDFDFQPGTNGESRTSYRFLTRLIPVGRGANSEPSFIARMVNQQTTSASGETTFVVRTSEAACR